LADLISIEDSTDVIANAIWSCSLLGGNGSLSFLSDEIDIAG